MRFKPLNIIYMSVNETDIPIRDDNWGTLRLSSEEDTFLPLRFKPSFPQYKQDEIMYIELLQNALDILVTHVPMDR